MSEIGEAIEGAVALIAGGFILLLFTNAIGIDSYPNLSLWGFLAIELGFLLLITTVAVGFGELLSRLA